MQCLSGFRWARQVPRRAISGRRRGSRHPFLVFKRLRTNWGDGQLPSA